MNRVKTWEMEFNSIKCHVMECNSHKLVQNIISIIKEEKDLEVVIKDNLSPEKHVNRIFGDVFRKLRNIQMAFHVLDENMMRKIIIAIIRIKREYTNVIWSTHKKAF